ncbi:MAG: response regulator [Candidatus Gracilibacteria bacterium]
MEEHNKTDPDRKINILAVDDNPTNLNLLENIFYKKYNIIKADTAKRALEILKEDSDFALLLLDVVMPDVNGLELARIIQQTPETKDIPIIFLTGNNDNKSTLEGYASGAVDYIMKPFNKNILCSKVEIFAQLYKKTEALKRQAVELEKLNLLLQMKEEESQREKEQIKLVNQELVLKATSLQESQFQADRLKALGNLASGIAHDLNNALTPIMLITQLLATKVSDEQSQKMIDTLSSNTQYCSNLVKQILTFARGVEGSKEVIDIGLYIADALSTIQGSIPVNINITTDIPADLQKIFADKTQIYQIIINLLINARDAMPQGGNIHISAQNIYVDNFFASMHTEAKAGHHIMFSVADNGSGITPDVLSKIFDPYFTTKSADKGTGLGLSMVMSIISGHGGFINVASKEGQGTTFKFYLPSVQNEVPAKLTKDTVETFNGQNSLILIVDDNKPIREAAEHTLKESNFQVITAKDGVEALTLYLEYKNKIKVVLTDYNMPVMDGLGTIRALRSFDPSVKIILTSGTGKDIESVRHLGPDIKFLAKPYMTRDLLKLLDELQQDPSTDECK